ncbi:MAG: hypothetical protein LAN71_12330 [Acidobacteriia bacterium]|nr:hypothetical protein [Terriglobia bacterium]
MKVEKQKFDAALEKLLKAKSQPRSKIKVAKKKPAKLIDAKTAVALSEGAGRI